MATIVENADKVIKDREEWLKDAQKAKQLVSLLPPEIQNLNGEANCYNGKDKELEVELYAFANEKVDLLKVCKLAGVQGLTPTMRSPNDWTATGKAILKGDVTVTFELKCLPKPPTCRIEEYQETVTKYRAICAETGEEIK